MQWFNDVYSTEISDKCEDALNLLSKYHGCEVSSSLVLCFFMIVFKICYFLIKESEF